MGQSRPLFRLFSSFFSLQYSYVRSGWWLSTIQLYKAQNGFEGLWYLLPHKKRSLALTSEEPPQALTSPPPLRSSPCASWPIAKTFLSELETFPFVACLRPSDLITDLHIFCKSPFPSLRLKLNYAARPLLACAK